MEVILYKDKVTKNTIRFAEQSDGHPKQLYLLKTEVAELGNPDKIKLTVTKA